jgi:hypothetical protein
MYKPSFASSDCPGANSNWSAGTSVDGDVGILYEGLKPASPSDPLISPDEPGGPLGSTTFGASD